MRILLFSDSHGDLRGMERAIAKNAGVDMIIHLGDCVSDILKIMEKYGGYRYEFVQGNNDWSRRYPTEKTLELEGRRIFITHSHQHNVKYDYRRIAARGNSIHADAVFFGHTHEPEEFFSEGMLVLNPGSVSASRNLSKKATYSLLEISGERLVSRFMGFQ
jgi:putative phosphoesterase